jgi:hypothetical protein
MALILIGASGNWSVYNSQTGTYFNAAMIRSA